MLESLFNKVADIQATLSKRESNTGAVTASANPLKANAATIMKPVN